MKFKKDDVVQVITGKYKGQEGRIIKVYPDKNSPARRVDFLYAPPDEYAFAILYFTGSKTFNTLMRKIFLH